MGWVLVVILLCCTAASGQLETHIVPSLARLLQATHLVFVGSSDLSTIRRLSEDGVFVSRIELDAVAEFLRSSPPVVYRTMIVVPSDVRWTAIRDLFNLGDLRNTRSLYTWVLVARAAQDVHITVPFDCEFIIVDLEEGTMTETYTAGQHVFSEGFGRWTAGQGLTATPPDLHYLYLRRRNLKGTPFVVYVLAAFMGLPEGMPITFDDIETHPKAGLYRRYLEMWMDIGRKFNYSTSLTTVEKDVDAWLLAAPFVVDPQFPTRLAPIMFFNAYLNIRRPSGTLRNATYYLDPFQLNLWLALAGWLLFCSLYSSFVQMVQSKRSGRRFWLWEWCFTPLEAVCNQSGGPESCDVPYRICCISARALAAVMVPAFSAALLSYLAIRHSPVPFHNLAGFIKDGTYKLGGANNTYRTQYFEMHPGPINDLIRRKFFVPLSEMPLTAQEGLVKMCREKFALVSINREVFFTGPPCRYLEVRDPVFGGFSCMNLRSWMPFQRAFQDSLTPHYAAGLMFRHVRLLFEWSPVVDTHEDPLEAVGFESVQQVLALVLIGGAASIVILAVELFIHHSRPSRARATKTKELRKLRRIIVG